MQTIFHKQNINILNTDKIQLATVQPFSPLLYLGPMFKEDQEDLCT